MLPPPHPFARCVDLRRCRALPAHVASDRCAPVTCRSPADEGLRGLERALQARQHRCEAVQQPGRGPGGAHLLPDQGRHRCAPAGLGWAGLAGCLLARQARAGLLLLLLLLLVSSHCAGAARRWRAAGTATLRCRPPTWLAALLAPPPRRRACARLTPWTAARTAHPPAAPLAPARSSLTPTPSSACVSAVQCRMARRDPCCAAAAAVLLLLVAVLQALLRRRAVGVLWLMAPARPA